MVSKLSELNAHWGTAYRPKSKLQSRLSVLRRSWRESLLRIVASEICNSYRRIRVILKTPSLRHGPEIPRGVFCHDGESFYQENRFQRACIENMAQLKNENCWFGYLEAQMAAQAFQRGARWGLCSSYNETRNEKSFLLIPAGGNSMPPEATQQGFPVLTLGTAAMTVPPPYHSGPASVRP